MRIRYLVYLVARHIMLTVMSKTYSHSDYESIALESNEDPPLAPPPVVESSNKRSTTVKYFAMGSAIICFAVIIAMMFSTQQANTPSSIATVEKSVVVTHSSPSLRTDAAPVGTDVNAAISEPSLSVVHNTTVVTSSSSSGPVKPVVDGTVTISSTPTVATNKELPPLNDHKTDQKEVPNKTTSDKTIVRNDPEPPSPQANSVNPPPQNGAEDSNKSSLQKDLNAEEAVKGDVKKEDTIEKKSMNPPFTGKQSKHLHEKKIEKDSANANPVEQKVQTKVADPVKAVTQNVPGTDLPSSKSNIPPPSNSLGGDENKPTAEVDHGSVDSGTDSGDAVVIKADGKKKHTSHKKNSLNPQPADKPSKHSHGKDVVKDSANKNVADQKVPTKVKDSVKAASTNVPVPAASNSNLPPPPPQSSEESASQDSVHFDEESTKVHHSKKKHHHTSKKNSLDPQSTVTTKNADHDANKHVHSTHHHDANKNAKDANKDKLTTN